MRNWVEYCNATTGEYAELRKAGGHPGPRNVPIWSIGNENYWPTEIGHKPIKQWAVALVNRHPDQPLACTIKFKESPLEGTFDAGVLQGDSPEVFNDVEHPNRVVPEKKRLTPKQGVVELPPHSLTILKVGFTGAQTK